MGVRVGHRRRRCYSSGGAWALMQRVSWRHGEYYRRDDIEKGGRWRSSSSCDRAVPRRRASVMTAATGLSPANGVVQEGAGGVVMARARGEGEGGTDATRRRSALARPVPCPCALWHGLGVSGRVAFWAFSCSSLLRAWSNRFMGARRVSRTLWCFAEVRGGEDGMERGMTCTAWSCPCSYHAQGLSLALGNIYWVQGGAVDDLCMRVEAKTHQVLVCVE
jgi:hypothetical protein